MKTLKFPRHGLGTHPYRAAIVGAVAVMSIAGGALASTSATLVTGTYAYTSPSGPKTVTVDAHGTYPSKGTWTFTNRTWVSLSVARSHAS